MLTTKRPKLSQERHSRKISGINIQWPWSQYLLDGRKKIETRSYPIPEKHKGMELAIIETPGPKSKSNGISKARIIGTIVFKDCYKYKTKSSWAKEKELHLVEPNDPQYKYDSNQDKWAWIVSEVKPLSPPKPAPKKRGIIFARNCQV